MKKVIFVSILVMLSCFALRAQTTNLEFINTSSSDEIFISIPELFGEDLYLPKNEIVTIKVDNDLITKKDKHEIFVYYPLCKNKEKTYIKIDKVNRIGDIVEPCLEAKIKNCNFPEGKAFVKLTNATGKEISILNGPLQGLSLSPDQESGIIAFPIGRNSLFMESFIDTSDHNKGVDKRNYQFFAIQDSSCLSNVAIKIVEETQPANELRAELKIYVQNRTDRKITIMSEPFEGISLAPGKRSSKLNVAKILSGIYPITIEFLDNYGNKVSKIVLKHLVEGDRTMTITQKDLGIEAIPRVKNYSNRNRNYRSYYGSINY